MPRAKTGCNVYLNVSVTKKAAESLVKQAKAAGVSRPVYLNELILKADPAKIKVTMPAYTPHKPLPRVTSST